MIGVYIIGIMVIGWIVKVGMDTYAKRERYRSEQAMMGHSERMKQELIQDNAVTRELSESLAKLAEEQHSLRKENDELRDRVRNLEALLNSPKDSEV